MIRTMRYQKSAPLFTISVAAQLSKLHPRTLMLYEKAGLIKPFRTKTDRRRYSQGDLDKIRMTFEKRKDDVARKLDEIKRQIGSLLALKGSVEVLLSDITAPLMEVAKEGFVLEQA